MIIGCLISGRGSNLAAILRAIEGGTLKASIAVVLSNRADAAGLGVAAACGIPTRTLSQLDHSSREDFDRALVQELRIHAVDTVVLAGFDRLVTPVLLGAFPHRVVNIHPALLPAFPGLHAQRQALEHGARITGVTVHLVDEQIDHGPILGQAAVLVEEEDTEATLAARILEEEHRLFPAILQRLAEGQIAIDGRRVKGGLP